MSGLLDGRAAVVTGAGAGIGAAIATALTAAGARVCVSDLDVAAAAAVAGKLGGAVAIACDVRDEGQVEALMGEAHASFGGLDIIVANAGVARLGFLSEISLDEWRAVTSVNLDGVFLCTRYGAPLLSDGGAIVNIASITAQAAVPLCGAYAAAKAGVVSLTQTAAIELRARGIRVNAVLPGFAETAMVAAHKRTFEQRLGIPDFDALIAMKQGRYGRADEIAALAVFLASERAAFCTGGSYVLDGGARASML